MFVLGEGWEICLSLERIEVVIFSLNIPKII